MREQIKTIYGKECLKCGNLYSNDLFECPKCGEIFGKQIRMLVRIKIIRASYVNDNQDVPLNIAA